MNGSPYLRQTFHAGRTTRECMRTDRLLSGTSASRSSTGLHVPVSRPEDAALRLDLVFNRTIYAFASCTLLKRTKLAGICQPGKTAAAGKPGGPTISQPAKTPAQLAAPQQAKRRPHDANLRPCAGL